ncbi:LCP family protein [Streptomyces sp. bgisy100]|uniref:LCP family protein n=1 Tax=Streptomyces sp. bgisy100 TaxID=3413783 RepID=UPI003D741386
MNDWPEGWTGDSRDRYGRGSASSRPESARAMRHVQRGGGGYGGGQQAEPPMPPHLSPHGGSVPGQRGPDDYAEYDNGYNTGQVYGGGRGGRAGGDQYGRPAPDWRRRIKIGAITLVVALLAVSIGTYFWADSKLQRRVDLSKVIERPETGEGTNYLIVGSDSREGMTAADKKKLRTGSAPGKRTDSMMILHVGSNGNTMISLPRDSDVEIPSYRGSDSGKLFPGQGRHTKLNASYSEDGPQLLVRTVESNTGLHIDHYAEIGFGGFAKIVDAVGGVEMNIPKGFKDEKSGADFKSGKQTLDGPQALAFVRTRYALPGSDLDRTKNQQKFLSALASQTATPSTVLNPFRLYPTMGAGLDTLVVDKDMGLFDLSEMFFAMKSVSGGEGKQLNMPTSGSVGGNLQWDKAKVRQLVSQLKNDEKVTVSSN